MRPIAPLVLLVWGCHAPRPIALEADPNAAFDAARIEAARLVPDAARGGPAIVPLASPLPPFAGVNRATAIYVGDRACASCHPGADHVWVQSRHAQAWATLKQARASSRVDCVGCHTTGSLHPTGFSAGCDSPCTDLRVAVQCESCHGPGNDHLVGQKSGVPEPMPYGTLPMSQAACVACHTWETSPDFDWATAWAQIAHGR